MRTSFHSIPRNPLRTVRPLIALLFCSLLSSVSAITLFAQQAATQRDHLTPQEAELVRNEQRIDRRTEIFIKAIDRRLLLLATEMPLGEAKESILPRAADAKNVGKRDDGKKDAGKTDEEKYGVLSAATSADILSDVARILDEATTNIDDASERKRQPELLPKALRKLSDAAARYLTQLTPLRDRADEPTRLRLEQAIENAQAIVDAADKLRD